MPRLLRITTVSITLSVLLRWQLRFMNKYFETHAASAPGKELFELKSEENTIFHAIPMERTPSLITDLKSLFNMRKLMGSVRPDIVHTHTPKGGLLGMMAAWFSRVPVRLHTVAGIPWMESEGKRRKILKAIEKLTYRFATHVYSNSFALRAFILENRLLSPSKISVIANGSSDGINTEWYKCSAEMFHSAETLKRELGITDESVILFVGRLVKDKGIEELLKAFQEIRPRHRVKLLLVGPLEKERDPLSSWAEALLNDDPNIITTGYVNDVRPYIAMSHLLAFPSYREGFPSVPMQAGAMGIPSVVTDINGCNEIIEHEVNGLIVPPKSTKALIKAIRRLLQDQILYDDLASNARPMIVSRFDQQVFWNALLEEYISHLRKAGYDV